MFVSSLVSQLLTEKLFAAGEFRFSLGISSLEPTDFFRNGDSDELLTLRFQALESSREDYLQTISDEGAWRSLQGFVERMEPGTNRETIEALGKTWEPDFVVLSREAPHEVKGGCVCFPSGWSLKEKIGGSLFRTHGPVPGLNDDLGANISKLLSRLEVGQFLQRSNWGLTGSSQLDQHPRHAIPAIPALVVPSEIYLRIEWQALTGISAEALLFGIRVFHVPIDELKRLSGLATRLADNLETMPDAVARYKRLTDCRAGVAAYLRILGNR